MDCPKRGRAVPGLPDDIVVDILSGVPAKWVRELKLVSPAWRNLISDPIHHKRIPQTLEGFFRGDRGGDIDDTYGLYTNLSGGPGPELDPSFSFLTKLPWIERVILTGSCNGLLLFECATRNPDSHGYIVCNPATEEFVFVPSPSGHPPPGYLEERHTIGTDGKSVEAYTFLMFDPAVSSHFHLVQLWQQIQYSDAVGVEALHFYSSETREWSGRSIQWKQTVVLRYFGTALVDGMLHFAVWNGMEENGLIVAVDGEGNSWRTIRWPEKHRLVGCRLHIGQSQGRLVCISIAVDKKYWDPYPHDNKLSVWVLEDYNTQNWILKLNLRCSKVFGRVCSAMFELDIVAIHPDRNVIFFVQHWKDKSLVSYDMDSGKLRVIQILGNGHWCYMIPYVPYFMESAAVANKY